MIEWSKQFVCVEVLPVVEFQLETGISDEEAVKLLDTPTTQSEAWTQSLDTNTQSLRLDEAVTSLPDPFTARLVTFEVPLALLVVFTSLHAMTSINPPALLATLLV